MNGFWTTALDRMLRVFVRNGLLRVILPGGETFDYGDGTGTPLTVRLHSDAAVKQFVRNPELALGESYMTGMLTIDGDALQAFLALVVQNVNQGPDSRVWWQKPMLALRTQLRRMAQKNIATRARRNAAHHYDLSGQLYALFLDEDRQYSCGYFTDPDTSLRQAQQDKKAHIARKLLVKPGMQVLDIGCGWGGMVMTLAQDYGARVLGITLSTEQQAYATERARKAGLSDRVEFQLRDYRSLDGSFDRIVSVGMFEHVGLRYFDEYFQAIRNHLTPDGIALVHTIGWTASAKATNPWIAKHIFPGGYIPTVSEAMTSIEKARLWPADIECWRLHYAYTLRHWFDRFSANADAVEALYDAQFVRMWRFYLAASEQTFRHGHQAVFQFQLSRSVDAVPLTRDYLYQPLGAALSDGRKPVPTRGPGHNGDRPGI